VSNRTHRTLPAAKDERPQAPSNWGGGVWQLAILAAGAVTLVLVMGPASSDSQKSFREALVGLSLMALAIAVVLQQLKRMRWQSGGNARH
jgi:hypothetical protein